MLRPVYMAHNDLDSNPRPDVLMDPYQEWVEYSEWCMALGAWDLAGNTESHSLSIH